MLKAKFLKEDKKAKSKSFFLTRESQTFDENYIKFLIKFYKKTKKDIRICLHPSKKSNHHDMVILQQKNNFYKPHKHLRKGETYHIIEGSMICIILSDKGKIQKSCIIKKMIFLEHL